MDVSTFRATFPEFSDATVYTDPSIEFWLDLGKNMVNERVWGNLYDRGVALIAAHHLVIGNANVNSSKLGVSPGKVEGPVNSKSVDKVSKSMDTGAVTNDGASFFNQTSYGVQYIYWARLLGAGGIQL